jgi:hypothetical protein
VLDDEESNVVTAGAIVTVNVLLTRNSMGSLIKGEVTALKTSANVSAMENEDHEEDKENQEVVEADEPSQPKKPVWQKKKSGKKSGGNKKQPHQNQKKPAHSVVVKRNVKPAAAEAEEVEVVEKQKDLKELPEVDDSEDEGASEGTASDTENSSSDHDKVYITYPR